MQQGELSSGRQALEGAELAPGNGVTLAALRRRHAVPQNPIPELPPDRPIFHLDESLFSKNVRSARRRVVGGPSGMTSDHLRPLLEQPKDLHLLFLVVEAFSRGVVPDSTVQILRIGRMTGLRKKDAGVRGIVVGEVVIRRLVARTVAQQLGPAVEAATSPFQCALSTRAGCECISHVLQALSELDTDATVTSIDGISAYDTISRRAMLQGLERMPGGAAVSPFVRLFYSSPSEYWWEDDGGEVHSIH